MSVQRSSRHYENKTQNRQISTSFPGLLSSHRPGGKDIKRSLIYKGYI